MGTSHLSTDDLNAMIDAVTAVLDAQTMRKPHLVAMGIVNLTYELRREESPDQSRPAQLLLPRLEPFIIPHPGYRGTLRLKLPLNSRPDRPN